MTIDSDFDGNGLYPPHIFNPPQEEIDRIVPRLVWPQGKLRVIGMEVYGQNTIYDIGDGRIVKTGRTVTIDEAKAMVFIREHTNIPVPKVYMVFQYDGWVHIVMERIDGVALRESQMYNADGTFDPEASLTPRDGLRGVMQQLQEIIDEIRSLGHRFPQRMSQFGSWPCGPYRNSYFTDKLPATPFRTISEFHEYWLERLDKTYEGAPVVQPVVEQLRQLRDKSTLYHACTPVLSHGDLAPRNILVKGDRIVAIVDWETFGWYPAFWEVMAARNELMSKALIEAQSDIFGEITLEDGVYLRVRRCLAASSF